MRFLADLVSVVLRGAGRAPEVEVPSRWRAVLALACPRCRRGPIYRSFLTPHRECPCCGLVILRQPGYDIGSYYISYELGIDSRLPLAIALLPLDLPALLYMGLLALQIGLVSPFLVRWSRAIWYHFDQAFDPR